MILSDSMSRTQFSPVIGMGSIIEEGIIWHMEFLHTPTNSLDRIILVAIVYNDISRLCRIILFSIDASDSQKASIKVVGRLPLEFKTPLPILLLPLQCYQESFMVITERTVCVLSADDISCGNVLYPVVPISSNDFDSNTNEDILITSYSLCADPTLPYMYLGTAEGYLLKLDISDLDSMKWIACQKVNPIGQQMCVLGLIQVDDDEGELWMAEALFYVGESADSQLVAIPWNDGDSCNTSAPFVLQTLVNRAPLTDWQIVRKNGQPDRLVTCSGQDEQGALHYISRDVDSTTLYASDVNWNGITKMWCLSNSLGRCHLVASSSYSTRVALLDYEDRMDEDTTEIVETQVPSIYAGSFKVHLHGTVVIQITQDGTTLLDVDGVLLLRCPNSSGFTTVIVPHG
ncbi:mono-functional DNA-alkylating methyl methanesulfonate N-term-domain-containing protein [Absidia repens]|uniref:Mono-functional DNA-alkylating methyl methanesulfonate N-term-domain-containing protein n=1 Tax=Absidia repens TaxID=90262 RepID=A0A1X2J018_9FUNG|nr:mono-functional DNA-alkylating methyl methanesulfonate N-term-domain-containing protein [Absidia repens]